MSMMMKVCDVCLTTGHLADESVIYGEYRFVYGYNDKQLIWVHELSWSNDHVPVPHEPMYVIEEEPA